MKKFLLISLLVLMLFISGCSVLESVAPPPEATPIPTEKEVQPTSEPTAPLGEREYISAVYCWESHFDDGEFNLVRFFPSGWLIDVFLQPYASCEEAWEASKQYLVEESLSQFNHGEYHLSGDKIQYTLSPPNSNEISGTITGTYSVGAMTLNRVGSEEREYILITSGE
jgi:hypothetical protein